MGHETGKRGGEQRVKPRSPRKRGGGGEKHPSRESGESPVATFRTSGEICHREISHTFEIRNFPQRNIPPAKSPPRCTGKIAPQLSMVKGKAQGRLSLLRGTPIEEKVR